MRYDCGRKNGSFFAKNRVVLWAVLGAFSEGKKFFRFFPFKPFLFFGKYGMIKEVYRERL